MGVRAGEISSPLDLGFPAAMRARRSSTRSSATTPHSPSERRAPAGRVTRAPGSSRQTDGFVSNGHPSLGFWNQDLEAVTCGPQKGRCPDGTGRYNGTQMACAMGPWNNMAGATQQSDCHYCGAGKFSAQAAQAAESACKS